MTAPNMKSSPNEKDKPSPTPAPSGSGLSRISLRHLMYGWALLVFFLSLGIVLEALHGFKSGFYLDVTSETRRLMWRLAHAHGTFLGLLQIAFAFSVTRLASWPGKLRNFASLCLNAACVLLPVGFFLGGFSIRGGDPGLGILLVPLGALMLLVAGMLTALATRNEMNQ